MISLPQDDADHVVMHHIESDEERLRARTLEERRKRRTERLRVREQQLQHYYATMSWHMVVVDWLHAGSERYLIPLILALCSLVTCVIGFTIALFEPPGSCYFDSSVIAPMTSPCTCSFVGPHGHLIWTLHLSCAWSTFLPNPYVYFLCLHIALLCYAPFWMASPMVCCQPTISPTRALTLTRAPTVCVRTGPRICSVLHPTAVLRWQCRSVLDLVLDRLWCNHGVSGTCCSCIVLACISTAS
jgi:hypothetical protein